MHLKALHPADAYATSWMLRDILTTSIPLEQCQSRFHSLAVREKHFIALPSQRFVGSLSSLVGFGRGEVHPGFSPFGGKRLGRFQKHCASARASRLGNNKQVVERIDRLGCDRAESGIQLTEAHSLPVFAKCQHHSRLVVLQSRIDERPGQHQVGRLLIKLPVGVKQRGNDFHVGKSGKAGLNKGHLFGWLKVVTKAQALFLTCTVWAFHGLGPQFIRTCLGGQNVTHPAVTLYQRKATTILDDSPRIGSTSGRRVLRVAIGAKQSEV